MRKILFFILLATLLVPLRTQAQGTASLGSVFVQLWPEFDRPSTLVMYNISLPPQTKLPSEIHVRIPAKAGKPNAVAYCEQPTSCNDNPYTQQPPNGDWSELVIPITLPADIRVEYYDPSLVKNGSNRQFTFTWPGDAAVNNLTVQIQQPIRASQMTIKPGTVQESTGQDGMKYYNLNVGAVPAGQQVEVQVQYVKDNDELSNQSLPVAPAEPLNNNSWSLPVSNALLIPMLGLLGALLIVGGGIWYWLSGRQQPLPEGLRRRAQGRGRRSTTQASEEGAGEEVYCHQCGNRASPGDRFCRVCGTPLRRS